MAADAESIAAAALSGASFPVQQGPERAEPDESIFVVSTGGPAPFPELANGTTTRYVRVSVIVRSDRGEYSTGYAETLDVWDLLDRAQPSGAVTIRHTSSAPNYFGPDEEGRHRWSIPIVVVIDD